MTKTKTRDEKSVEISAKSDTFVEASIEPFISMFLGELNGACNYQLFHSGIYNKNNRGLW